MIQWTSASLVKFFSTSKTNYGFLAKSHMINGFRCDVKKALSRDELARSQQLQQDRMLRSFRTRGRGRGSFMPMFQGGRGDVTAGGPFMPMFQGGMVDGAAGGPVMPMFQGGRGGGAAGGFREPHGYFSY